MHWASSYIGIPWERGASGPDSYDCWGFAVEVERTHFGRELPRIDERVRDSLAAAKMIRDHDERRNWNEVWVPVNGDLVLMARKSIPIHIGVWIRANSRGGVLHCLERSGVVFSLPHTLQMMGFGGIRYYHPKD